MKRSAAAIGTFDGVHLGHRFLIDNLKRIAARKKLESVVVALKRPVRIVSGLLTSIEEKVELIRGAGVDRIIVLDVNAGLTGQSPEDFFNELLVKELQVKELVVGQNFAFGRNRQGNAEWIKENAGKFGVNATLVKPLVYHGETISSTRIRMLLGESRVDYANRLLGRFYKIAGAKVDGRKIGRKLGFRTVNLMPENEKIVPQGIFAGLVSRTGSARLFPAAINIGTRPTFLKNGEVLIEANLMDFNGSWGKTGADVFLCHHIRSEQRFSSVKLLKEQIARDVQHVKDFFKI
jgi:riboflavin kinase / FMN adenylyltransferase